MEQGHVVLDYLFYTTHLCFSKVKLIETVTPKKFSPELPKEDFLIFTDFKLNGDGNKWHLEEWALKLLQQNQSKRLSIVVSESNIASKNVSLQLYGLVSSELFEKSDL